MHTMQGRPLRLAIAAGGTGGHVMPALALAESLRESRPNLELLFLCGERPQERAWFQAAGHNPRLLPAAPLGRGAIGKLRGLIGAVRSYGQARHVLRDWGAQGVAGLGGYVSGPCVLAGAHLGLPTIIHEQNAVAGKTNRWLARRVSVAATTYPAAFDGLGARQVVETGNPLRREALEGPDQMAARQYFELDPLSPTILISGGSQGARRLNDAALEMVCEDSSATAPPFQLLWLVGASHYDAVAGRLEGGSSERRVKALPFESRMGRAYAAADIVVCRAGSASLAEASAWGLPMIVVPYPSAADDHQRKNAAIYQEAGACVIIEDAQLSGRSLKETVDGLLKNAERRRAMGEAAGKLAAPDAADRLARLTLETIGAS